MTEIQRKEGRHLFGEDVDNYAHYRPPYPEQVFTLLQEEEGLFLGSHTLEVGAGSGLATTRLLNLGAKPMVIVEPDARFNAVLQEIAGSSNSPVTILNQPLEEVDLEPAVFDLAVSATAFHWIDQSIGLRKIAGLLRRDGLWAMWWNVFGDPSRPDSFRQATDELLKPLMPSPSHRHRSHFTLDKAERLADIEKVGQLMPPRVEEIRWRLLLNMKQLRGLYSTFSPIQKQAPTERQRLLDALSTIAENEFGGIVERPMVTVIYLTRRK